MLNLVTTGSLADTHNPLRMGTTDDLSKLKQVEFYFHYLFKLPEISNFSFQ